MIRGPAGEQRLPHLQGALPPDIRTKDIEDVFYKYGAIRDIDPEESPRRTALRLSLSSRTRGGAYPGTCGLEDIGWSSWGVLQGLRENGDVGSEVGSKTSRPRTSEVRSRVGESFPGDFSPGVSGAGSRAPGETEALRAAVVVGSLACFWVGEGRPYYAAHVGSSTPGAHVRGAAGSPTGGHPSRPFFLPFGFL